MAVTGNALNKECLDVLKLIERFESDESVRGEDAEKLVLQIFVGCGLPAVHRGGPKDQGVDVEFTTDDAHGGERFAVQVKTNRAGRPVSASSIQYNIREAVGGSFDRWLFVSNTGFTRQARQLAEIRNFKAELLSPPELRRWVDRFAYSKTPGGSRLDVIVRTAMKEVARHLAECPEILYRVEWRDLERLLREVFEGIGFGTELTRSGKDGGFDLRLTFDEDGHRRVYLVEVKHWALLLDQEPQSSSTFPMSSSRRQLMVVCCYQPPASARKSPKE